MSMREPSVMVAYNRNSSRERAGCHRSSHSVWAFEDLLFKPDWTQDPLMLLINFHKWEKERYHPSFNRIAFSNSMVYIKY